MNRILPFLFLLFSVAVSAQRLKQAVQIPSAPHTIQASHPQTEFGFVSKIWTEKENYLNGFARVLKDNKFSFIDKNGNLICPIQFEDARNFVNHLAAVKKDSKWGFINEEGKVVIPFQYEIVYDFKERITGVFTNNKWLLIDTKGIVLGQPGISVFYGFNNGNAKLIKDG